MLHFNPWAFLPFAILLGTAFAGTLVSGFAARMQRPSRQAEPKRPSAQILAFPAPFQTALNARTS